MSTLSRGREREEQGTWPKDQSEETSQRKMRPWSGQEEEETQVKQKSGGQ